MMSSYVKISKETWADTRQYLFEMLDTSDDIIFRGQCDAIWPLESSFFRLEKTLKLTEREETDSLENALIEKFKEESIRLRLRIQTSAISSASALSRNIMVCQRDYWTGRTRRIVLPSSPLTVVALSRCLVPTSLCGV